MFKMLESGRVIAVAKAQVDLGTLARLSTKRAIVPCTRGEAVAHYRKGAAYVAPLVEYDYSEEEDDYDGKYTPDVDITSNDPSMYVNGVHVDDLADQYYTQ